MKELDLQIRVFVWACVIAAAITASLIGCYVCNVFDEVSYLGVAIVAMSVVTVMLGIILTILLLMEKQCLPEIIHNENILHELLAKMIADSKIKEEYEKECNDLKAKIDTEVIKKTKELEARLKAYLDELKKEIEDNAKKTV